jgi:hypothetical protein
VMVPSASFASRAIDIDLAQQIKESQNSEAKATSCSLLVNTGCRRYQRGREPLPPHMGQGPCLLRRNRDGTAQRRENIQPAMPRIHALKGTLSAMQVISKTRASRCPYRSIGRPELRQDAEHSLTNGPLSQPCLHPAEPDVRALKRGAGYDRCC